MQDLKITAEKVREAASKCSTAAATLKTLFPEAFEDDGPFDFGRMRVLDTSTTDGPLAIANGCAPIGLEYKSLVVCDGWEMKTQTNGRWTILTFHKEK